MASDFVRIPVTREWLEMMFCKSETAFKCVEGLDESYKCIGVVQDPLNGTFYFMMSNGKASEGAAAVNFMPEHERIEPTHKPEREE